MLGLSPIARRPPLARAPAPGADGGSRRRPESSVSLPSIIYLLGRLGYGGAEMRSLQLFRAIRERYPAIEIVVYVTSLEPGLLDGRFEQAGLRIARGRAGARGFVDFWRACRRSRATLAHANAGTTSGFFALAAFLAGVKKRVCHFRLTSEDRIGIPGRLRGRVGARLVLLFGTGIVGVCASARHPRVPERRWRTIYNGIECDALETALRKRRAVGRNEAATMIVLARISPEKDYLRPVRILEALARRSEGRPYRLDFVGTGSARDVERLEARIAASPAGGSIVVHGPSDEPLDHLRNADVLLLTTLREGLSGSVLEALSVGTPVVTSDLPGLREIAAAVEGVTLMPSGASDAQWSDAIVAALSEDRAEAIIASFRRGPFGFERYVAEMAALWGLPEAEHRSRH